MNTSALEPKILDMVATMRAEHGACTMRALAGALRLSDTGARNILEGMRARGLVAWTKMPGSLSVVGVADPELAARPSLPPPPPPAGATPGVIDDMQAELNRLIARCLDLEAQLAAKPTVRAKGKGLNAGQKAAAVRAKRDPTPAELASRERFAEMGRARKGVKRSAPAGDAAAPEGEQQPADADPREESLAAS